MNPALDIFSFIKQQETNYLRPIDLNGWNWSMNEHLKTSFYYKHGRLLEGNLPSIPVKNITRPMLNLQYRAEDIDVKDIVLYVDDPDSYHLSFLVKKYHDDVFVIENDLDSFFDELKEQKIDYGGGLCLKLNNARPQVIDLRSIAFCDQTNMLAGPIGLRFFYSPDELKEMERIGGWGKKENGATITIDSLIALSEPKKSQDNETEITSDTPTYYVEVYAVRGVMPSSFLPEEERNGERFSYQFHVVAFYKNQEDKGKKMGVSLFAKKAKKDDLKLVVRDKIPGRGLGFGGAEELFEPQAWTNHDVIRKKDLLDAAAKIILKTTDQTVVQRHPSGLKNVDNLEIIHLAEGSDLGQVDTLPRQMALFDRSVNEWFEYARLMSGSTEALLGESPTAGTPFKLQNLVTTQGQGLHDYRRGKFAKFIEEVYKDWIIPHIQDKITEGAEFLSELSSDEMRFVGDALVRNESNRYIKRKILAGGIIKDGEVDAYKELVYSSFSKGGTKKFLKVLKGEFKRQPLRVKINVAGKQKNLAQMTDSLVNIFRQIIASPEGFVQMMQIPAMAQNFSKILEYSGLNATDFGGLQYMKMTPSPMSEELPVKATA